MGHGCCTGGMGHGFHHGRMMSGCCCGGMGFRRFISPAEELERLKNYLEELKKEVAGVEARIHELKGK
jgi:predicted  nucleic acid-binding Zn-ribbon protein